MVGWLGGGGGGCESWEMRERGGSRESTTVLRSDTDFRARVSLFSEFRIQTVPTEFNIYTLTAERSMCLLRLFRSLSFP